MDKKYWENYYTLGKVSREPSLFAKFILGNHLAEQESLLELGCGNGRDCVFFARHNVNVLAVDQCEDEITALSKKDVYDNLRFMQDDFTRLGDIGMFDHIYSRFTLHSIKEKEEDDVIAWAYKHLKYGGKLLIEARNKKNELYKLGDSVPGELDAYVYNNHYRRFIDTDNLRDKLEKVGFEVVLFEEITLFIANKIKFNIRELEGALTRVVAFCSLSKKPLNLEIAKQALQDIIPREKQITLDLIQTKVAEYFDLHVLDMKKKNRSKNVALPRQIAMYLARDLTEHSSPEIGENFGGRDHTTVLHACRKIEAGVRTDENLQRIVEELTQIIKE